MAGYEIIERVRSEPLCVTYKANHAAMARLVSLKALTHEADEAAVARFYQTAKLAARVHHANIASIYDVSSSGSLHFCTMEHVEGVSVGELLRSRQKIASADAVRVAIDVAEALRFAASKGVPGWRLSADRVFLTPRGEVKLLPPSFAAPDAAPLSDHYILAAVGLLLYAMLSGGRVPKLEAALEPGSPIPGQLPRLKTVALGTRQDIARAVDRLLGVGDTPFASTQMGIAGLRELVATQERLESRTRSATERARERKKRSLYGVLLAVGLAAIPLVIVIVLILGRALSQGDVAADFEKFNATAQGHIAAYDAARKVFFHNPTEAGATTAVAHLQNARAAYAAFYAQHAHHTKGNIAAHNIRSIDDGIQSFRAEARVRILHAASLRRIKEIDKTFEREVAAKLRTGGRVDLAAWRARYQALIKQFARAPKAQEAVASRLRTLPRRVQRAQMEIETNQLDKDFNAKYRPAHRYREALAAWEAYRQKYDAIDFLRKEALQNYQTKTDLIERDAREQYTRLTTQAQHLTTKKDYAAARKLYQKIVDDFGVPTLVERAKRKLAGLPKG